MISVIIPVYNAERYLRRCLDSVLNSAYRDFELILINDGSADGSLKICQEYAAREGRITLISQENRGVSAARNQGLEACRGEWVVFVDADDVISPDFLGMAAREEYRSQDLLLFDFFGQAPDQPQPMPDRKPVCYTEEDMPDLIRALLLQRQLMEGGNVNLLSPCAKAYRRELIERFSLRFSPELTFGEDQLFNMEYFMKAERCTYIPAPVYRYYFYSDSSSHRFGPDRVNTITAMLEKMGVVLEKNNAFPKLEADFYSRVMKYFIFLLFLVVFNPRNTMPYRDKCGLCKGLYETNLYRLAMKHDHSYGALRWRVLFFAFRMRWYRVMSLLGRLNYSLLKLKNPGIEKETEEMRDDGWFP